MFKNTEKLIDNKSDKIKKVLVGLSALIAIPSATMVYNTRGNRYISNTIDKSYNISLNKGGLI